MSSVARKKCRGCSVMVLFAKNETGKVIPLDTQAPTYEIKTDLLGQQVAIRTDTVYVSHFSTCPKANDFSKGKRL